MNRAQVKRDFTPEQIVELLASLGSESHRQEYGEGKPLVFQTICHNPPQCGSYKLYYYPESQRFHCYTHCGDTFDVYELVMRSRKCSFFEALRYIQGVLNIPLEPRKGFMDAPQDAPQEVDDWELLNKYASRRKKQEPHQYTVLPPNLPDYYTKAYPVEWQREGIPPWVMEKFNIRFSVVDNEVIIPHYNAQGQLIGLRSRSFDAGKIAAGCKYMPTALEDTLFRHSLRHNLYGLHLTKEAIQRTRKVMIVEAEKSVMQTYAMYGAQCFTVAVCGSNISLEQRSILLGLGVQEVFLAMDKQYEEAYTPKSDAYADKILRLAHMFTPYVTTYVLYDTQGLLGYKDSPTDKGQAVLERLMASKFEIETIPEKKMGIQGG